jgi:adenine-specific DNA-methyltransferase
VKERATVKYHQLSTEKTFGEEGTSQYTSLELPDSSERRLTNEELGDVISIPAGSKIFSASPMVSQSAIDLKKKIWACTV